MRIALGVEYDGRHFNGWQTQAGEGDTVRTVQAAVERALSKVADTPIQVICAGRTDTGVHATEQVVHIETDVQRRMRSWVFGGNTNLPSDVNLLWACPMPDDFHARFSAQQRHYRYRILNRPTRSAVWAGRATWFYRPLDIARMQAAANSLLGEHDFSSFRAQGCQAKSPVRNLIQLDVHREGEHVVLAVSANAFLQHMVRNLAGVLMAIGCGKAEVSWAKDVLEHRDRTAGGVTAPPDGLYFTQVDYPEQYAFDKTVDLS